MIEKNQIWSFKYNKNILIKIIDVQDNRVDVQTADSNLIWFYERPYDMIVEEIQKHYEYEDELTREEIIKDIIE